MAAEFSVKLSQPVSLQAVLSHAQDLVTGLGPLQMPLLADKDVRVGSSEFHDFVIAGPETEVSVLCHSIGSEEEYGYHGGYWLTFTADRWKNGPSVALAFVLAISTADLIDSDVLDEPCRLSEQRILSVQDAKALLAHLTPQGSFQELAASIEAKVWSTRT